uniref:Triple gene block protein 1 n=1 Tax=Cherry rusty mottle associated virus TaxID=1312929 RepID=A0A0U2D8D6_9VIRU|nr:triple gene block protein 1 [Cherry rusty mottle associated virus]
MEAAHTSLLDAGFSRTSFSLSFPVVVHGVPGCGKSTLVKRLLDIEDFNAQSYGVVKPTTLAGRGVEKALQPLQSGFNILDEYLSGPSYEGFDLLLSDPYQNFRKPLTAHFINSCTYRFGNSVCEYLNKLGFEIQSKRERDTELIFGHIFGGKIRGEIICFEKEVEELLNSHSAKYHHPCNLRGAEFEHVTFITAHSDLQEIVGPDLYVALTRASESLTILKP